ncbi:MAG: immunity protein 19 [Gracilibacteraceae bacterium]|nr:immunity protein 19 [Gracilibacteraceae bacterium]
MGEAGRPFDYSFANTNFWWFYILYNMFAHDNEKEMNLDDAIHEVIGPDPAGSLEWSIAFYPKNEADKNGLLANPHTITRKLTDARMPSHTSSPGGISFAIEFHFSKTTYFLNDIYIGNHGGHFEMWFLTWDELLAFGKYGEEIFLLLLTMTGIEEEQRQAAETRISRSLKSLPMFADHSDYIARCICNGLVIEGRFSVVEGVGLTNNQNHSLRNVTKYTYNRDHLVALNQALKDFCNDGERI